MAAILVGLASFLLASGTADAVASIGSGRSMTHAATKMYHKELERMKKEQSKNVAALENNMTFHEAYNMLQKNPKAPAELFALVKEHRALLNPRQNKQDGFLGLVQHQSTPDVGYSGLDKARDMLNKMLDEVGQKHDEETMRCQGFFSSQCAMMEICRQDISSSNAAAADARSRILSAQKEINFCEIQLPRLRHDLWENERACTARIKDLEDSLKIVMADIEVMVSILEMTDCEKDAGPTATTATAFIQVKRVTDLRLVKCQCANNQSVIHMHHKELSKSLSQLKSADLRHSVMKTLKDLAAAQPVVIGDAMANVTNFTNPPLPQTEVPANPCKGIGFRDEPEGDKCSLASNPQCYKLQERFLNIQSGIEDTRDKLMSELDDTKTRCRITKETLEGEIDALEQTLSAEQEKLATGVSNENNAGERGRTKGEEHHNLAHDMFSTREECSSNLETFESEQCALKKIRGELYKVKGTAAFFQD